MPGKGGAPAALWIASGATRARLYPTRRGPNARRNEVPDAHLAALMRQYGVRSIYSRGRRFRDFEGLEVRDPLA